jgi:hypothetical protein
MNAKTQKGLIKEDEHNRLKVHLNAVYGRLVVEYSEIRPHYQPSAHDRIIETGQMIIESIQNTIGNNE